MNDKTGIINTKYYPPGWDVNNKRGNEARAYYNLNPYPYHAFTQWRLEVHGPYPRCLPIERMCIDRASRWLFGKPIKLNFAGPSNIEKLLNRFFSINRMNERLVAASQMGSKDGGIFIKFTLDTKSSIPVRFQILSCCDHVTLFYDPHDSEKLLMVRIQYSYFDTKLNKWMMYREEWTDEWEVHFNPVEMPEFVQDRIFSSMFKLDPKLALGMNDQTWVIDTNLTVENKFKVIPGVHIRNTDGQQGDFWDLHRWVDRLNLAYHIMDRSNQLDIDPITLFIDLEPKEGDSIDRPKHPGGIMDLKSIESDPELGEKKSQGRAQILETQGKMREHLRHYARDIVQILFDTVGAVFPRQEDITNKGSLTQSVLIQMFLPLLEVIDEKRKAYGDNGVCRLMSTLALALRNFGYAPFKGSLSGVKSIFDEKIQCNITWFTQFQMTEDEKLSEFTRIDSEHKSGFVSTETAVDKIHQLEEIIIDDQQRKELIEDAETRRESGTDEGFGGDSGRVEGPRAQKSGPRVRDAE